MTPYSPPPALPRVWEPLLQVIQSHPRYEEPFVRCINELFYGAGPLRVHERHYIALMAASRHRCSFMLNLFEREFEAAGGDLGWLKGLKFCKNSKLIVLDEMNRLLAHQPWLCLADTIQRLTKNESGPHLSLQELVHAAIVLSHTHALCSFAEAIGAVPIEISSSERQSMASRCEWLARDKENTGARRKGEIEDLLKRMNRLRAVAADGSDERGKETFERLHEQPEDGGSGGDSPTSAGDGSLLQNFQRFTGNLSFTYVDFQSRSDSTKTFKIHEFSWDQHGYVILEDLYNEVTGKLDEKFNLTQNLTYKTMGQYEDVDTSAYRMAVWNYIQALYGIRHDDYDYSEVNTMLSREMKTFIKTVACFPHRVTDSLRNGVMVDFKASEKVHVMLMIMESRLQAALLYFTRALTNYYASDRRSAMR
ncbi:unnamed protein product, partial [Mesorhabditis belari]|uniref:Sestrin n=1 Tax=Mesorhabditis belari TaxID=2138241 RepID=A0AAF3EV80_9BILA